ncbi:MAG: polysaccharide biosynthesis/export family protein [Desulfatitalea sp.]
MNSGYLKQIAVLLAAVLLAGLSAGTALAAEVKTPAVGDYLIGPGDVLDIAVWKNADLTKMVTVLPDGKISFPLVGPMTAADKTVSQLSTELRDRLTRYVPDVDLSIIVVKVNSQIIYVIGRVNDPGRFELNTNVTVMQALAMAGGLNPFAKKGDIKIFRKGLADPGYFKFDYDDVSTGVNLAQDIWLKRGDLIVVP